MAMLINQTISIMLGHLKPILCHLSQDSKALYWQFYCSGCHALRQENNLAYSLLLNHELTLLLYAFQDEYKEANPIKTRCPATAFLFTKPSFSHTAMDKSAQLSIVLGWIKALDWNTDNPTLFHKTLLKSLSKKAKRIISSLQPSSQQTIAHYAQLTQENEQDFDLIRLQSRQLSQMLVDEIALCIDANPETTNVIRHLFGKAGELIAIADHLIDLEKDISGKQYNPIIYYSEKKQTSLAEEYISLKRNFHQLKYEIQSLLPSMNPLFVETFQQSLQQLEGKIRKYLPTCMKSEEAKEMIGRLQITQAGFSNMPPMINPSDECCDEVVATCLVACIQSACMCCCEEGCNNCCDGNSEERRRRREERRLRRW
jgi:hypothetical protein